MKLFVQRMNFQQRWIYKVDPPILTASAPEGTSELFHTKYFDQDAFYLKVVSYT